MLVARSSASPQPAGQLTPNDQAATGTTAAQQTGTTQAPPAAGANGQAPGAQPNGQAPSSQTAATTVADAQPPAAGTTVAGDSAQPSGAQPSSAVAPRAQAANAPAANAPAANAPVAAAGAPPSVASGTTAGSGTASSLAGQAQTSSTTTQVSAGLAGGGAGPLAIQNQNTTSVQDSGAASAETGVSVALEPTPSSGITTATSGTSSATGLTAQNTTSHTALAAVQIEGTNQAPVSITSSSTTAVQDTGASAATTGQAWAVAPGGGTLPASLAGDPTVAGSSTTPATSTTGLFARNTLQGSATATMTVPGGTSPSGSISLSPSQSVSVVSGGVGLASSAAAVANATPQPLVPAPNVQASSGAAVAQGLVAQNVVDTHAMASVHVAGQNFAPIQIVIDTITNIFNFGAASANSGPATAGGGAAPGAQGGTASSGAAQATGAQVINQVDLRSSAAVVVTGDNHNPITLILNLSANLINWGLGVASSGGAQSAADPSHAGSASSGSAQANGLLVANLVEMWADASVDIQGNNYAPIRIEIDFTTNIQNAGGAVASSGAARAGSRAGASTGAADATTTGSAGLASSARAGTAAAVAPQTAATFSSNQISVANGSHPIVTPNITNLLRGVPAASAWSPFLDSLAGPDSQPPVQPGLVARTGDAVAVGMNSSIIESNTQVAACADPTVACVASNSASLAVVSRDLPTNPVDGTPGDPHATTAGAFANATPPPLASPATPASADESSGRQSGRPQQPGTSASSGGNLSLRVNSNQVVSGLPRPRGHVVLVDLWDQWPGRRLPPTPRQLLHTPTQRQVDANGDVGWPGVDELPVPVPVLDAAAAPSAAPAAAARPAARRMDTPLAEEADATPPLPVIDVDPWDWPELDALPLPVLARTAAPVATEQSGAIVDSAVGLEAPPTAGPAGLPAEVAGLAIAALAVGWAGGTRRGRMFMKRLCRRPRLAGWLGGSNRTLGRLAIGLRLWIIDRNGN